MFRNQGSFISGCWRFQNGGAQDVTNHTQAVAAAWQAPPGVDHYPALTVPMHVQGHMAILRW